MVDAMKNDHITPFEHQNSINPIAEYSAITTEPVKIECCMSGCVHWYMIIFMSLTNSILYETEDGVESEFEKFEKQMQKKNST